MRLLKKPVLCNYYLTYRCNAACSFCDLWEKPSPYAIPEEVDRNLFALKKLGVKVIDFTGGEPLLHRRLPEFLSLAKKYGFITTVTTNTLLYPKMADKLKGLVDMLHFSLDSIDPELHNESRKVNCYDFLIQSIAIARDLKERPDILFTVNNENVHEIPEVYDRFVQKEDLVLILNPIFSYNGVGSELNKESISIMRTWLFKRNVYLNEAFLDLRETGGNKIARPVCKAGETTIVISPENKLILPCYHLGGKEYPIEGNLENLFQQEDVQKERMKAGKHQACEGCTVNCYMEPSMVVEVNRYWMNSMKSTVKYALEKWVY